MTTRSGDNYKHYIPDLLLSIERNTENVPKDGKYYLLRDGEIVEGFRTLKKAQMAFKQALDKIGYTPKPSEESAKSAAEQRIQAYLDAKELYWAESHKYGGKGGKGGRGGV
jgi:hypothetical protein